MCEQSLEKTFAVDTIAHTLVLSHLHSAKGLKVSDVTIWIVSITSVGVLRKAQIVHRLVNGNYFFSRYATLHPTLLVRPSIHPSIHTSIHPSIQKISGFKNEQIPLLK